MLSIRAKEKMIFVSFLFIEQKYSNESVLTNKSQTHLNLGSIFLINYYLVSGFKIVEIYSNFSCNLNLSA